ncbi:MAG TPA: DUF2336 domain-containing protein [Caulobacteraceae bacterium]|nr:DUF2336 domain-containing protein [Caulobacteraceae bacterium]
MTPTTDGLLALAKSRDPRDREQLLAAVVDICETSNVTGESLEPAVAALVESIFMTLVVEAEADIRRRLSERLANADWAPCALINVLALDDIEVARPIIAASPVLKDEDLIRLLVEATIEHQIEVARRPRLGAPVVEAILRQEEPAVLTALATNDTADICETGMVRLVEASRRIAALRSPLARHPKLSSELAEQLYLWVGQSLRTAIVSRFKVDAAKLDAAIAAAVRDAHGNAPLIGPTVVWERAGEREQMEARLIEKLAAANQLRPGYLLRVLKEQKLSLFQAALARLGGFDADQVRRAVCSNDRPELLALACAAVGIDRGAFPTILALVREINGGRPGGGAEGARRAISAFGPFSPDIAAAAFRQAISGAA